MTETTINTMTKLGYARASTDDQDCSIQVQALQAAGCGLIRSEKKSGSTIQGRHELEALLAILRPGDVLVVSRIDRLARSVRDLEDIVATIRQRGASLQATEQSIDTSTPAGVAFLQMLGVFAQFETALRKERQAEGIAKAKADGRYRGRKPSVPVDDVRRLRAEGVSPTDISKRLGIGRASVYRALGVAGRPG